MLNGVEIRDVDRVHAKIVDVVPCECIGVRGHRLIVFARAGDRMHGPAPEQIHDPNDPHAE
jgi:RNA-binding protein YhbY